MRSREVRLTKDPEGVRKWAATDTMDDHVRALKEAVEAGRFDTQQKLADHLGWDKSKVTRTKIAAFKAGAMTEREWDTWMEHARVAQGEGPDF